MPAKRDSMFEKTISDLKSLGHIKEDDIVIACIDRASIGVGLAFGALGAAIANSRADTYIMAANADGITLFDVDKKTGAYLGTQSKLAKEEIIEATAAGALGSFGITVKITSEKRAYSTNTKFRGYQQKEELNKLKEFFKANFGKTK